MIEDVFTKADERAAGAADWLRRLRDGLIEGKDLSLELTAAGLGGAMWREMKENARLSSVGETGAMRIMLREVRSALAAAGGGRAAQGWELHVVAHSAGSIYAAHAMQLLLDSGVPLASLHLMAPAITVELFNATLRPLIEAGKCPVPDTYVLSDQGERDDTVGPYGKSLLYLVSNAFEARRATPILGMEKFIRPVPEGPKVEPALRALLEPTLVVAGATPPAGLGPSRSNSHGGFDNDADTLNSILRRILGGAPARPFTTRDLQY
ncbi:hypothetical protein JYK14_18945 [Siccirubricoccus sp. KC 17139]|uniref:Alpha/beta hydrolase n=1 Tax=Siccirubricoccus soli TaxID=2899147 RepID=A0ABT1DAG1_9PROT|nr:hypothetical protein [Siccirubricoccus soli]MCO6418225.1 hypothetical protein [Siccirubricoccus soli]MCP2684360.1 hypothetical protein [Siccirubricoccus soli]